MKTNHLFKVQLAALLLLSTILYQPSTLHAQGSLTPPGAPAPTMKSLDQIEARTAITNTASLVTISQPGSYYLTRNLTVSTGDGIDITTNNVTLDLNGFTISSTAASATGTGISLNGALSDITIVNGHIHSGVTNNGSGVYSGSGFGYGIYNSGGAPVNVLVSRISVSGCLYDGIYLNTGNSTVVESCTVRTMGTYGIFAITVKSSSAMDCGSTAIQGVQASDCYGQSSGGYGISATTELNCYGSSSGNSPGLSASAALNCCGSCSGNSPGLSASTAQNCYGLSSGGTGLSANYALNCYGSNTGPTSSGTGLYASIAQNCCGSSSAFGTGLNSGVAQNCIGSSLYGQGLYATTTLNCNGYCNAGSSPGLNATMANSCYGYSSSGTGLSATIANSCWIGHGTTNITYKYNMP
jgi:hypothetical protein